jgi:DNA-binding beta-propeller fold protein YncE
LWVSDNGPDTVDVFLANQLTTTDNVTPFLTISSSPAFNGPLGIVLHNGKLYVANNGGTTIYVFDQPLLAGALPGPLHLTPIAIISDDGEDSIQAPGALIFDSKSDLWSSNANLPNALVEFTDNQIAASGSPTSVITISPANVGKMVLTSLSAPNGIAFDHSGNLAAVSSATLFGVAHYQPKELRKSADVQPHVLIVGAKTTLNPPAGDNFGPFITQ